MADTIPSPNMGMPVPTVSEAPSPGWATNIDASLSIVDSHNHSTGQGVQINPTGLNINTDLPMGNNDLVTVRSINFQVQPTPLATGTDVGCIYVSGVDLYYNDENGNTIRITQSGSVTGASGTITGLPSGTASAAYSAGTFVFLSATATPASFSIGPLTIALNSAGSKTITIAPNAGQAANYNITLPAALPAASNYMTLDNTGAISFNSSGTTGTGAVVLGTNPSFLSGITFTSGAMVDYAEGTWVPTISPGTGAGTHTASLIGTARYQRVGNVVTCRLQMATSTATGSTRNFIFSLPIAPANNFSGISEAEGFLGGTTLNAQGLGIQATSGAKTVETMSGVGQTLTFAVVFIYYVNN